MPKEWQQWIQTVRWTLLPATVPKSINSISLVHLSSSFFPLDPTFQRYLNWLQSWEHKATSLFNSICTYLFLLRHGIHQSRRNKATHSTIHAVYSWKHKRNKGNSSMFKAHQNTVLMKVLENWSNEIMNKNSHSFDQ